MPYDSGLAFVRNGEHLRAAMSITAAYLPNDGTRRSRSDTTPELSRRARGVDVWAALSALGRSGVIAMIERCCRHARRFAAGLHAEGHCILDEVVLNQVLASLGNAVVTRRVIARLQHEGTCWCGVTEWQGQVAMRISVSAWGPPGQTSNSASPRCCGRQPSRSAARRADRREFYFTGMTVLRSTGTAVTLFLAEPSIRRSE